MNINVVIANQMFELIDEYTPKYDTTHGGESYFRLKRSSSAWGESAWGAIRKWAQEGIRVPISLTDGPTPVNFYAVITDAIKVEDYLAVNLVSDMPSKEVSERKEKSISDYLVPIGEHDWYEQKMGIKIDILNNEIVILEECSCDDMDDGVDPDCKDCNGTGYTLTPVGRQFLDAVEAIPFIKEILED